VNLGNEANAQRHAAGPLSPQEQRQYPKGLQDGLAGLDDARYALVAAVKRLERGVIDVAT
jgi:hypothetical protein